MYKPGRVPVSSSGKTHKLSSNETPFAPLPSVVDAIAEAARSVHRYPDNGAQALIGAIADLLGVITVDDVLEIALPPDWRRREAAQPPDTHPF